MKSFRNFAIAVGIFGTLTIQSTFATTGSDTWNGGANPNFDWSGSANWTGANTPPAANDTLLFDLTTGLNNTNDLAAGTQFNGIFFNPTAGAFNLYGNPIILGGGITNNSANTQTINLAMSLGAARTFNGASGPLVINGPITNTTTKGFAVTLSGNGTLMDLLYMNATTPVGVSLVVNGTWNMLDGTGNGSQIQVYTNTASTGAPIGIAGGGTFNYGSLSSAPNLLIGTNASVSVSTGTSGTGIMNMTNGVLTLGGLNVVNNNSGSAIGILNVVGGTLNMGLGAGFGLTIGNNPVGGTATMNVSGGTVNVTDKSGNTAAGNISIATRGTCALNISGSGLVECATLTVNNAQSSGQHGTVTLNGGTLLASSITTRNTANGGGAMISYNSGTVQAGASSTTFISQSAGIVLTNQILAGGAIFNTAGFNDTVTLPLVTGASPDGGLTKNGVGTLTLGAANTYNGNTTINNGSLALGASGSINSSSAIVVSGGATFDVSAVASFSLASGQILSNSTSTAVLNGNANSGSGTLSLTYAAGTPAFIVTNGTWTLSSGTMFKVNNTGSALAAGSYKLIAAAATGGAGSVTGTLPTVTVSGGGIAAGAAASLQITGNELYLVVAVPVPHITGISISGTTLSIQGTNGSASGQYVLLSSTNVALPLSQWTPVLTNAFDNNGNLNLSTNIINPNNGQEFYILSQ